MNVIIFGKTGQVGSSLIDQLEESGDKNLQFKGYSSKDVNFAKLEDVSKFLINLKNKPDLIINCAAYTNVDKAEDEKELANLINHKAVEIIANFCFENSITLIHYSTDYVFDGSGDEPFYPDNTKNLNPVNYYGITKLDGEKAIINSGCNYMIIRISWIYNKMPQFRNFYNTIKNLSKQKETLEIVSDQIGSPTNSDDVAKKTIEIINKLQPTQKIQNITHYSDGNFISWHEFATIIVKDLKKSGENIATKEIKPINSNQYQTKAKRPLNSRLKNR